MFKIIKENTEEEMIRKEQTDLEGEFYYMSTRYQSLIPLINEVKSLRGEIEHFKSITSELAERIENIVSYIKKHTIEDKEDEKRK